MRDPSAIVAAFLLVTLWAFMMTAELASAALRIGFAVMRYGLLLCALVCASIAYGAFHRALGAEIVLVAYTGEANVSHNGACKAAVEWAKTHDTIPAHICQKGKATRRAY